MLIEATLVFVYVLQRLAVRDRLLQVDKPALICCEENRSLDLVCMGSPGEPLDFVDYVFRGTSPLENAYLGLGSISYLERGDLQNWRVAGVTVDEQKIPKTLANQLCAYVRVDV